MKAPYCPLRLHSQRVQRAGEAMLRSLRRLRRSLVKCEACPLDEGCSLRQEFDLEVDAILAEINAEWGMIER